ncbi:MAG: multidrug transporter [Acidobacteriota bacterium]
MSSNQISLSASSITRVLGTVAGVLVLISTVGQLTAYLTGHNHIHGLVPLFYVDAELNIPTFFSTLLLLIASLLLTVITLLERNLAAARVWQWALLAAGFLLMTADEAFSIHEALMVPTRDLLGEGVFRAFYFPWIVPAGVMILVLAPLFFKFLWHLPRRTRVIFLTAAVLFVGGSLGFELIGGRYARLHGLNNLTYSMIAGCEECLEMAGVIVFIRGLLLYLAEYYGEVRFRFDTAP